MSSREEAPSSLFSSNTNDSDWSDINTEDEDEEDKQNTDRKLSIDLDESLVTAEVKDDNVSDLNLSNSSMNTPLSSSKKAKRLAKKLGSCSSRRRQHSKLRKTLASIDSVPPEIMSVAEIEKFQTRLDAAAKQLKFNRRQVKSVIRTLVKSPDLYNLILVKAGEKKEMDPSASVEPRLTRKVAKEVVETGGSLNWFLDKVSKTPGKSTTEQSSALLNVDFPDDESDQEYDPLKDPEAAEALSDDESVATGTPNSSIVSHDTMATPVSEGRLKHGVEAPSVSPERNSTFKRPLEASKVSRSLFFDNSTGENEHVSMSPRLTRSKASLKQITIEELESQFVPCDITPDMYDNDVDDYTLFLAETFGQPPVPEPVQDLEVETDPDFVYQESEELIDIPDEFVHNRSTKISQKEVDELMKELFEAYDLDNAESSAKKAKKNVQVCESLQESQCVSVEYQSNPVFHLSQEQVNLIQQQMRLHIQLLTQSGLLSAGSKELQDVHQDSRNMLSELMGSSFAKPFSVFAQDNLFTSINFLNEWGDECPLEADQRKTLKKFELSARLMSRMGESSVFIYPNILPTCGFGPETPGKSVWVEPEDYLIALGLEQFIVETAKPEKHLTLVRNGSVFLVNQGIVKNKTVEQVRVRIKNKRCTMRKSSQCGAIDYFIKFNQAPRISHTEIQSYDSSKVVCPRFSDPAKLPHNWKIFFNMSPNDSKPKKLAKPSKPVFFGQSTLCSPILPQLVASEPSRIETQDLPISKISQQRKGTFSRSPLKKERDRLLKKYSPMKRKAGKTNRTPDFSNQETFTNLNFSQFFMKDPNTVSESYNLNQAPSKVSPRSILATAIREISRDKDFLNTPNKPVDVQSSDCVYYPEVVQEIMSKENDQGEPDFACPNSLPQGAKRRTKQIREAEMTLQLLEKESCLDSAYRREQEALDLVITAKDILPLEKINFFYQKIIAFKNDSIQAFMELHPLCEGHPTLQEMLLDILSPTDALKIGPELSDQYELRQLMKSFFRKLRIFYANQPLIRTRILKEISTILTEPHVTVEDLKNFANKNFKSNQHLYNCFVTMFPKMPYPETLLPEPEIINLSDEDDDDEDISMDGCERVSLSSVPDESSFGGENCPCLCHLRSNSPHCIHCSIKFKNGRVFIREGKSLRRVTVHYPPEPKTDISMPIDPLFDGMSLPS